MQWLLLPTMEPYLHDDRSYAKGSWEACAARCMSWDEGPCKSFDWRVLQSNFVLCRLSHADQHANPENMIESVESVFQYVENCEGKNTLSQSFDQENNYIKSGKSPFKVREFYLSEFVKMDSASNYIINVYRRRTVCGQHAIATYWHFFITTDCLVTSLF